MFIKSIFNLHISVNKTNMDVKFIQREDKDAETIKITYLLKAW